MVQLDTVIFNHQGRFFRFKKVEGEYICDVCYWKGVLHEHPDGWTAKVLQKFDPFDHHRTESAYKTADEAMRWVADQLAKK